MVFQSFNLFERKTALENVEEGLIVVQKKSKEEAKKIALEELRRVGMINWANHYPRHLSGGQRQRVEMCIRDSYYTVAPRYGTNEDLANLFREAHAKGMHVILDLVPGHTAVTHKWFRESMKAEKNAYTDRYIWTDNIWEEPKGIGCIRGCLLYTSTGSCEADQ